MTARPATATRGQYRSRAADEQAIAMIRLRSHRTCAQIGARFGVTRVSVAVVTNRIREADLLESGEDRAAVAAAYGWGA